jgi:hypothetical protein
MVSPLAMMAALSTAFSSSLLAGSVKQSQKSAPISCASSATTVVWKLNQGGVVRGMPKQHPFYN